MDTPRRTVRMKKPWAVTIEADCGRCGESLTVTDGSYGLCPAQDGKHVKCSNCGTLNAFPKRVQVFNT